MNLYTIKYYYGEYSGTREIVAEDEDVAVSKMWNQLKSFMTLPMAYKSYEIIDVIYDYN